MDVPGSCDARRTTCAGRRGCGIGGSDTTEGGVWRQKLCLRWTSSTQGKGSGDQSSDASSAIECALTLTGSRPAEQPQYQAPRIPGEAERTDNAVVWRLLLRPPTMPHQ
jgi:hypothetical protein